MKVNAHKQTFFQSMHIWIFLQSIHVRFSFTLRGKGNKYPHTDIFHSTPCIFSLAPRGQVET